MSPRRSKRNREPVISICRGPDKKGRFSLPLANSEKSLYFYGGVPGEMLRVRRGKRGRRGEQGDLLEVVEPSSHRREPPCTHFGVCGGCTLQHLPETLALELKTEGHYAYLKKLFPDAEYLPPVSSPKNLAYRSKVELTFMEQPDKSLSLGFHRRGRFDRGVNLSRCHLSPISGQLLSDLRAWASQHQLKGWNPRRNEGDLRYLVYRHSSQTGESLIALVVNGESDFSEQSRLDLIELLQQNNVGGAFWLNQTSVGGAVVPDSCHHLFGLELLPEMLGSLQFELGWNSFFQVNPPAYEKLLQTMRQWRLTPRGGKILDLFCGVGTIGLSLYQEGDQVLGVELVEQAVLDARKNAARNDIPARFEHKGAEEHLELESDLLILDPPRSGCHPKLLKMLAKSAPSEELFYISCNPHRLVEEMEYLSAHYKLVRAQAFDFFPQTHHVEFLLQFVRLAH